MSATRRLETRRGCELDEAQAELRELLTASGMVRMTNRELGVLCSLLMQQQVEKATTQQGISVLSTT